MTRPRSFSHWPIALLVAALGCSSANPPVDGGSDVGAEASTDVPVGPDATPADAVIVDGAPTDALADVPSAADAACSDADPNRYGPAPDLSAQVPDRPVFRVLYATPDSAILSMVSGASTCESNPDGSMGANVLVPTAAGASSYYTLGVTVALASGSLAPSMTLRDFTAHTNVVTDVRVSASPEYGSPRGTLRNFRVQFALPSPASGPGAVGVPCYTSAPDHSDLWLLGCPAPH